MLVRPAAAVSQLNHSRQLQGSKVLLDNGGQKQGSPVELGRAWCRGAQPCTVVARCGALSTCLSDLLLQCHRHRALSPCLFVTMTCSWTVLASCSVQ